MRRFVRAAGLPAFFRIALTTLRRGVMHLLMGRRFMRSLEQNRAAAERLDQALQEMLQR